MSRLMQVVVVAMVLVGAAGCDVQVEVGDGGSGGGAGGTGGGAGGGTGGGSSAQWTPCSTSNPCPSGQFCFNGLCALGCQTNGNCGTDQYCDTDGDHLCHNSVVQTCSGSTGCLSSQVCITGLCSTPPPATMCDPNQVSSGNDGCDANSVCIDPLETSTTDPKCYTFPACAADKTCPTGLQGAVCNDGLIPQKNHICLIGVCKTADNCPNSWICVKLNATDVLGSCSNKGTGMPCNGPADCTSGACTKPFPSFLGICT